MFRVGILIPVFNKLEYTKKCLSNITGNLQLSHLNERFCIILVDDGSTDGTSDWVRKNYSGVTLLEGDGNLWWSGGINMGARYALEKLDCSHVLLWNNDIKIEDNYFMTVMDLIEHYDENTILGSKIYADNQRTIIWSMGGWFNPHTGSFGMKNYMVRDNEKYNTPVEADWLAGMGTIVPAGVIRKIGYWDEKNFPQYHGDTEFTYRAYLNGFRNIIDPKLLIWNDISNTGLSHKGSFKKLIQLLQDKRSLYNFRINMKFHQLYAKSPFAYFRILAMYFILFSGFFKWKFLSLLGIRKKEEN